MRATLLAPPSLSGDRRAGDLRCRGSATHSGQYSTGSLRVAQERTGQVCDSTRRTSPAPRFDGPVPQFGPRTWAAPTHPAQSARARYGPLPEQYGPTLWAAAAPLRGGAQDSRVSVLLLSPAQAPFRRTDLPPTAVPPLQQTGPVPPPRWACQVRACACKPARATRRLRTPAGGQVGAMWNYAPSCTAAMRRRPVGQQASRTHREHCGSLGAQICLPCRTKFT